MANVVTLFHESVAQQPEAVAISDGNTTLTYTELARAAYNVAEIVRRVCAPNDRVIVAAERTSQAVAAMIGVMAAGCAYVPIDPEEPALRAKALLDASGARLCLCDTTKGSLRQIAPGHTLDLEVAIEDHVPTIDVPIPADIAYVLFTSGSTGVPKGVPIRHDSLLAFLSGSREWARLTKQDRVACFHAFTFDISLWELWGALAAGARIEMIPRLGQLDPSFLHQMVIDRQITRLCQTPTALRRLTAIFDSREIPHTLRSLWIAGEKLEFQWLLPCAARIGEGLLEVWNLYGPTEATIYATGYRLDADDILGEPRSIIGSALPHVDVSVRRKDGSLAEPNEVGEIWISGVGVSDGYLATPAGSATRFFKDATDGRTFGTADLARQIDPQRIEFVGREAGFVKIRGYRVEPDELASALRTHPDIADAGAVDVDFLPGGPALVALVVLAEGRVVSEVELRRWVARRLPAHMRPARLYFATDLPRLASAKLDRHALRFDARKRFEGGSREARRD